MNTIMDASQDSVESENRDELELLLLTCDICTLTSNIPVLAPCGHFFCWSCLDRVSEGQQATSCPICSNNLLVREGTAHNVPVTRLTGSVGTTSATDDTVTVVIEPTHGQLVAQTAASDVTAIPLRPSLSTHGILLEFAGPEAFDGVPEYLDEIERHRIHIEIECLTERIRRDVNDISDDIIRFTFYVHVFNRS